MKPASRLSARPHFDERDLPGVLSDIERVLRSGKLILGEETQALEMDFARSVGTRHAIAVSSCTAALEIAFRALGIAGREVIVPTNTFSATAAAVLHAGGRVVFSECDSDGNSSVVDALCKLSADTAAIVVVHVAGFIPRDFDLLIAECNRRGIALVEDCAHAHGATMGGRQVGSFGDAGCFSFYPTKITTCGVGGMVTTNRDDVARVARSLRHHGQGASLEEVVALGHDWLMDEVRAVLLRAQLKRLPEVIAHRASVAAGYAGAISDSGDGRIVAPTIAPGTGPVWYKYPVALRGFDGPAIRRRMALRGIDVGQLYWPPVHKMPAYAGMGIEMPKTEAILRSRICLPMHAMVDSADCAEIVANLRECLDEEAVHVAA